MVVEKDRTMEAGLLLPRDQNDSEDCRITACVILSTFVAVCSSFSFGCATSFTSGSEAGIMEDLGLSVAEFSAFGSFSTLGAAVGALFSGKMADILGRRGTMWVADLLCIMGWLAIAFAKDVLWLDFGRISVGIGVGLISYVVPVYVAEITPKHIRGAFTFSNQLLQNSGIALIYFFGNFINWRILAVIGAVPCLVQVLCLFFVPESPRWLAKVGLEKELENSLHRLRGRDADISGEASEIQVMTEIAEQDSKSNCLHLFQKKYRRMLVVGIGLMLMQQFSGSAGVIFYASTIFRKAGFSVTIGSTVLGLFMIPKAMLGLILVDNWGRRPLLLASAAGMCLSSILLGASFTLQELQLLPELTPIFTFLGVLVFIATFAIGLGGLPWVIMSEIFPLNVKVTAGSLATVANWSSSWLITYTFNFMLEWSPPGTFYIFSVICGASLVFIWLLVPETRGLTLEEIQASLTQQPVTDLN